MVNSKQKGNRFERTIVKRFNDEFSEYFGEGFTRNIDSGSFFGKNNKDKENRKIMSEDYKSLHVGDIVTPLSFPFVVECKNYGLDSAPNMYTLLKSDDAVLVEWLTQAKGDAEFCNKEYIIIFNITRRACYVCVDYETFVRKCIKSFDDMPEKFIKYHDNIIVDYDLFINTYIRKYFPKEKR